jgi:anthranilate 1,2-dioxygenase small subunit
MTGAERLALYDLYAAYGGLIDAAEWDAWLDLFAAACRYKIIPRENAELGLPAGLIFCDSRAVLEDRIMALREANKYNIHWDRHVIGLPRVLGDAGGEISVQAPFAVYQSDQEGSSRLFATGLYRDRIISEGDRLKFRDKTVLLDTFAVPSLLEHRRIERNR